MLVCGNCVLLGDCNFFRLLSISSSDVTAVIADRTVLCTVDCDYHKAFNKFWRHLVEHILGTPAFNGNTALIRTLASSYWPLTILHVILRGQLLI